VGEMVLRMMIEQLRVRLVGYLAILPRRILGAPAPILIQKTDAAFKRIRLNIRCSAPASACSRKVVHRIRPRRHSPHL